MIYYLPGYTCMLNHLIALLWLLNIPSIAARPPLPDVPDCDTPSAGRRMYPRRIREQRIRSEY